MDNNLEKADEELLCSFCKKKKSQVSLLISGEGTASNICEGCIVNSFNLAVRQGVIQESNVMKLYRKSLIFFVVIIIFLSIIMIHIFIPSLFGFLIK